MKSGHIARSLSVLEVVCLRRRFQPIHVVPHANEVLLVNFDSIIALAYSKDPK